MPRGRERDYSDIGRIELKHLKRRAARHDSRRKKSEEKEFRKQLGFNETADLRDWKRLLRTTRALEDETLHALSEKHHLGIMEPPALKEKKCYAKKDLSNDELFLASCYFNEQLEKIGVLDLKMKAIERGFEVALKYTESGSFTAELSGKLDEMRKLKEQLKIEEIVAVKKFLEK